jgi:acyl-homoserine-lactone acylase
LFNKRKSDFSIFWLMVMMLAASPPAWSQNGKQTAEIRRTTDGIPHIRARGWHGLGEGIGYAQAQDALCTLAEAFVTFEGRCSWFFGAEGKPAVDSSLGQSRNIDLDFFVRAFADESLVNRYRKEQPAELNRLIDGFAVGYNKFLQEARNHPDQYAYRACLNAEWVREISAADLYRRMFIAQLMAGYTQFLPEIVNAAPNGEHAADVQRAETLHARLANSLGSDDTLGSNVIAWGQQATSGDGAVLFGNPHWYWGGPDRFYQMHLTIPGKLNVAGVSFLGIPLVMIGFNDHVAWSHTVSRARRFGLFELTLDPADPKRYLVDGASEPMHARQVRVDVRDADGQARQEVRTFYSTRYGPIVDLGHKNAALGWSDKHAITIRDVNAENLRIFRNFLAWNQATSLNEFIAIHRKETAMPWVNTVAIGKGDGRVWYADIRLARRASRKRRPRRGRPTTTIAVGTMVFR